MRILLAGAAGFIGTRESELLPADGHKVVGLDKLSDSCDVRMKECRLASLVTLPGFVSDRADVTHREEIECLRQIYTGSGASGSPPFDAVVNLATRAGVRASVVDSRIYLEASANG